MPSLRLPVLDQFIGDLRAIWAAETDNQHRMEQAKPLLEQLVMDPTLKAHSADWPSTEGRKNLLLYVDPDHLFVINAVVRVPGRTGRPRVQRALPHAQEPVGDRRRSGADPDQRLARRLGLDAQRLRRRGGRRRRRRRVG